MYTLDDPLVIRGRRFPSRLIQGPLAGVSSAPFRRLVSRWGGVAFCVTEMISASSLLHYPSQVKSLGYKDPSVYPDVGSNVYSLFVLLD